MFQRDLRRKYWAAFRRFHANSAGARAEIPPIRTFRLSLAFSRRAELREHACISARASSTQYDRFRALWNEEDVARGVQDPGTARLKIAAVRADAASDAFANATSTLR